jgi:hypothetical protein
LLIQCSNYMLRTKMIKYAAYHKNIASPLLDARFVT